MYKPTLSRIIKEYKTQLKKFNLKLRFKIEVSIGGQTLKWPERPDRPEVMAYTGHLPLRWDGRKIGDYYWAGELDKHQRSLNRFLLDNLTAKIQVAERANHAFNCGIGVLNSAVKAIEAKDPYTRGHSDRVALLSLEIANILDLDHSPDDVEIAAKLHDIGKIGISEKILTKAGILTGEEMEEIRKHPEIGAGILRPLAIFEHLIPVIRHHHERIDGTGYPDRLAGSDIPVLSRIIAVADTFDALTSNRPYRKAMTVEQALNIICEAKGSQLDPAYVDALLDIPGHSIMRLLTG